MLYRVKSETLGGGVSVHPDQFLKPPSLRTAYNKREQVDRFGDEFRLRRNAGFLHQAGKAGESSSRAIGVNRCYTAWMSSISTPSAGQGPRRRGLLR